MDRFSIDRGQMKLDARAAMREHTPSVYLVAFVFLVIMAVLDILSTKLQFPGMTLSEIASMYFEDATLERAVTAAMRNTSVGARFLGAAIQIMVSMISGGFLLFCLHVSRRSPAGVGTLFDLFAYFFRFLWLEILMGIFIFLWSLLLVIPGIVAAYRYSMALFIFFDDPEKGALQCIRESKEMTRGYKGQLFVLDLSFLGWILLSIIPVVRIFTEPYISVTKANYYRVLSGRADDPTQPRWQNYGEPWNS